MKGRLPLMAHLVASLQCPKFLQLGGKRTRLGHRETDANDPTETWRALIVAIRPALFSDPIKIKLGFRPTFERGSIFAVWLTRG
jgi:hypothetical protein